MLRSLNDFWTVKCSNVLIENSPAVAFEGFELSALCSCKRPGRAACSPKPDHGHHGDAGCHGDLGHHGHHHDDEGEDEDIQMIKKM